MTWAFRTFQCVELFKSQLEGVSLGKPGEKHPWLTGTIAISADVPPRPWKQICLQVIHSELAEALYLYWITGTCWKLWKKGAASPAGHITQMRDINSCWWQMLSHNNTFCPWILESGDLRLVKPFASVKAWRKHLSVRSVHTWKKLWFPYLQCPEEGSGGN